MNLQVGTPEGADFIINGVDVNLATMIANGEAQLVPTSEWGAIGVNQDEGIINPTSGNAESDGSGDQDTIIISFNIPITSLEVLETTGGLNNLLVDIAVDSDAVICFTRGTLIDTDKGAVLVEDLEEGMMVRTRDNGFQRIRWVGSTKRTGKGKMAPIRIAAGTLGNTRDLRVSPQHRMLLEGWQAELLYGEAEVLASAKSLVNDQTIRIEECDEVEYFHILFDTHEVIFAEGAPSESFHPAEMG
ncbi:MAG: Hint domain-containing protein, partial [Pseudomonadota bacterium]